MKKQIANLLEKHTAGELIEEIRLKDAERKDIAAYDAMTNEQREQHFRDYVNKLELTIGQENENCIYVKEFKDLQKMNIDCPNPYFMFWKASTDDKERKAHVEFGHWHMNRKWDKEYPTIEYYFRKSWIEQRMFLYWSELKDILKT